MQKGHKKFARMLIDRPHESSTARSHTWCVRVGWRKLGIREGPPHPTRKVRFVGGVACRERSVSYLTDLQGGGQLGPREHPRTKSERRLVDSALVVQPDVVCVLQSHYPLLRMGRFPPRRKLEKSNENLVKMGVGPF
jgi:hypothetical protein